MSATDAVRYESLLAIARGLVSEDGENFEYDRALIEVCLEAGGFPLTEVSGRYMMALLLGIKDPARHAGLRR